MTSKWPHGEHTTARATGACAVLSNYSVEITLKTRGPGTGHLGGGITVC